MTSTMSTPPSAISWTAEDAGATSSEGAEGLLTRLTSYAMRPKAAVVSASARALMKPS